MRTPTGKLIIATAERILATAAILEEATLDGPLAYEGTTEIDWNSQRTITSEQGGRIFIDEDHNYWTEAALRAGIIPDAFMTIIITSHESALVRVTAENDDDALDLARDMTHVEFDVEGCDYMIVNRGVPHA